ncbi:MAG: hypothetical protein AB7L90_18175 [Hyphomicrobiaceae bacterium]|uniref:hypothetical protein n=1 Tax=Pseudorhodoplanes sp. TaxID=1934341 RepID=UPI003D141C06
MHTQTLFVATLVLGAIGIGIGNGVTKLLPTASTTVESVAPECAFDLAPGMRLMEVMTTARGCSRISLRHHYTDGTTKTEITDPPTLAARVVHMDLIKYAQMKRSDPDRADDYARTSLYPMR